MEDGMTKRWLGAHKELLHAATRHSFILSIRDGSIDLGCFKRWLGQDYLFVRAFVRFAANVLVKLPKDVAETDIDVVLGGICALEKEISWFRSESSKWGVHFDTLIPQKANEDYCRFLEELSASSTHYAVVLAAFWAIEMVYNDAFATCLETDAKTPSELYDACERWGNAGFKAYCTALQQLADKHLQMSSIDIQGQAEQAFLKILSSEVEFWNMSCQ
ncbi:hypothetical protein KP509_05G099400 [Ceratopteris richardii]|uniref:Thiaminase-2/PQQC domain-containing protein n=1 Tax=Ceratopteris richardii TaxID=49495 RepID=A0A8T2UTN1_CERRI|nr:hypothetical protein KP509_05G099400 [Ceratopteris richardii]